MICTECKQPIAEKRMKAMPSATQCVQCLEKLGDVPPIRRFDEVGFDGEIISTFYEHNSYVESQQHRIGLFTAPDLEYDVIVDYEKFVKPVDHIKGYKLSEVFEEETEEDL